MAKPPIPPGQVKKNPPPPPPPPPPEPPPPTAGVAVVDPVTRLEGHLKIEVKVENGYVVDAHASGTLFRGFEQLLLGRHPSDAQHITQRICGVCPVSHGMASVMALDAAYGRTVSANSRIMRNLVMGANMLDSHLLQHNSNSPIHSFPINTHSSLLEHASERSPAKTPDPEQPRGALYQKSSASPTPIVIRSDR